MISVVVSIFLIEVGCMKFETMAIPKHIMSGTFMVMDQDGRLREEFSPNKRIKFLSVIPDLAKADKSSQLLLSGLLETIKMTCHESLGGSNCIIIPVGPRTLILYPVELCLTNGSKELFTVVLDSSANLSNPTTALYERRRIEQLLTPLKIQKFGKKYSIEKNSYYYSVINSIMSRVAFKDYVNELRNKIIRYIEPALWDTSIEIGVFMIFDSAHYYYGGCTYIDQKALSPETRIQRLIKQGTIQLKGLLNQQLTILEDSFGDITLGIHGKKDTSKEIYNQVLNMIENYYYYSPPVKEFKRSYPPVKEQNKTLAMIPMMESKLKLVVGFSASKHLSIQDLKELPETLLKHFQALDLTVMDDKPLTPGSPQYDDFTNALNNIIINK